MALIEMACPPCKGRGTLSPPKLGFTSVDVCPKCKGSRTIEIEAERLKHPCHQCDRTGFRSDEPGLCLACGGDGYDKPGKPTGPGTANLNLPSIQMRGGNAVSAGLPGVNIEVPHSRYRMTGHPLTVEIEETAKRRFIDSPEAVITDAESALAITISLQDILAQERSNSPEAGRAKALLEEQRDVLSSVIVALQTHSNEDPVRDSALKLLDNLMANLLRVWAEKGSVRGTLAAATITLAQVLGANLDWTAQVLIAGSFVGKDVIEKLKGWRNKDDADK